MLWALHWPLPERCDWADCGVPSWRRLTCRAQRPSCVRGPPLHRAPSSFLGGGCTLPLVPARPAQAEPCKQSASGFPLSQLASPCLRAVPPWQVNLSAVGVLIMFLSELFESVRLVRPCCRLLPPRGTAAAARCSCRRPHRRCCWQSSGPLPRHDPSWLCTAAPMPRHPTLPSRPARPPHPASGYDSAAADRPQIPPK